MKICLGAAPGSTGTPGKRLALALLKGDSKP
jgi:hypothetical protein